MTINEIGEFGLIEEIRKACSGIDAASGVTGIGDDCAILPQPGGMDILVSTDLLIEGRHFIRNKDNGRAVGWKSAAVNLSDVAAMGGRPVATFLSLALPDGLELDWVREFIEGYREISAKYSVPLLGGDTTSSDNGVCVNVTVMGESIQGKEKLRSAAQPGDLICVTGYLGDSAAGLHAILNEVSVDSVVKYLIDRHYLPEPRIAEGMELSACDGVHAMMDISDGIGSDLRHILKASGVGAEVDVDRIPLSSQAVEYCRRFGLDPFELASSGGEDYELLFTVSAEAEAVLAVPHFVVGRILPDAGCTLRWLGTESDYSGFRHF